jgi:hypothetical protein
MDSIRRKTLLALLTLPAGCAVQPLSAIRTQPLVGPDSGIQIRPPAIGQSWTYQKFNSYNSQLLATETEAVTALAPRIVLRRKNEAGLPLPEEHQLVWGQLLREPSWDYVQNYVEAVSLWPQPLAIGAYLSLHTRYLLDNNSFRFWVNDTVSVKSWETIFLPLGHFKAVRIERFIQLQHLDISRQKTIRRDTFWLVPEIGRWVAREITGEYLMPSDHGGYYGHEDNFRWELISWS